MGDEIYPASHNILIHTHFKTPLPISRSFAVRIKSEKLSHKKKKNKREEREERYILILLHSAISDDSE